METGPKEQDLKEDSRAQSRVKKARQNNETQKKRVVTHDKSDSERAGSLRDTPMPDAPAMEGEGDVETTVPRT
ncbi:hypothetical protein BDZ91DRAFT_793045 [Kalaharituber pfeilii]|nr:hypothetical protein BDZ91DRAFT_793045 [Kalaharituber pfeilii]